MATRRGNSLAFFLSLLLPLFTLSLPPPPLEQLFKKSGRKGDFFEERGLKTKDFAMATQKDDGRSSHCFTSNYAFKRITSKACRTEKGSRKRKRGKLKERRKGGKRQECFPGAIRYHYVPVDIQESLCNAPLRFSPPPEAIFFP